MHINTDSLAAFMAIHQEDNFTKAAKRLGITQSALSQKIGKLEDTLQATLFIRSKTGLTLTSSGEKLKRFAKQQLELESHFISQFDQYQEVLAGSLRIAGFSSIMKSVLIPATAEIMRNHNHCNIEYSSFEVVDLENVLKSNKADLIITDYKPTLPGLESVPLGKEEYVVIESKNFKKIPEIYLDHGPHDNATESYFKFQNQENLSSFRRGFMGDVYGIIEGVNQGIGKAVMSKHLIRDIDDIRIKKYPKRYFRNIYLSYFHQNYYSPLQELTCSTLKKNCSQYL